MCPKGGCPRSWPSPIASVRSSLSRSARATVREICRHLQRVREARAVVIALGRHEHLGLVGQAAKRLAVHDPIAIALKGRAQRAVLLRAHALRGIGARGQRREHALLQRAPPLERRSAASQLSASASPCARSDLGAPSGSSSVDRRRVLVVHRRPAARRGQDRGGGRVDPQVDAVLVQRLRRLPPPRSDAEWPGPVKTIPWKMSFSGAATTCARCPPAVPSDASTGTPLSSTW